MNSGLSVIKNILQTAPQKPGVYRMLGAKNSILYVGKAKNLLKRLTSYSLFNQLSERIKIMVTETVSLELIICDSEKQALLLEATLIKNLKPKYNILLKDDKSFPYILIRKDHEFGQILKHRGKKQYDGNYFGPFASATDVNKTIDLLQKLFLLRSCSDNYFKVRQRPCLEYQLKRCSAPCVNKISKKDYDYNLEQAELFLRGESKTIQQELVIKMEEASKFQLYEKAAEYRDRIITLNNIQATHNFTNNLKDADFIAIYTENNLCALQIFFFRNGQNFGNKCYFPSQIEELSLGEILAIFIADFYQHTNAPKEIYLNHQIENQKVLEEIFNTKFIIPKAGDKNKIMNFVLENAKNSLAAELSRNANYQKNLNELKHLLNIKNEISRIDIFDNSHISGKHALGAMVVFTKNGFNKKYYRTYNIKSAKTDNDYAMLVEALTRRYTRLKEEYPSYTTNMWPDLIIIDGGPGHFAVAKELFDKLNLNIPFICIAKGEKRNAGGETIYLVDKQPFTLENSNPTSQFLQRLRDEAHRFAITSHRKKRSKNTIKSSIDDIPNIGPKKKRILLNHFGSVKEIANASINDLSKVELIDKKTAEEIYYYFRSN